MAPIPMIVSYPEGHFCCLKRYQLSYLWKHSRY